MNKNILLTIILLTVVGSSVASADIFEKTGKIKRILTGQYYSGCMIYMDSAIGHGCLNNWISLDCNGLFNAKNKENGKRLLSSAMAAAHSGKRVAVIVNSAQKANGFCVARRLDVIF